MKHPSIRGLTTAQFAKLHEVNKRTLHYYDDIGLFSPQTRAENGYRYYDISQSIDFEYIRMLKELNMSIDEIENYQKQPSSDAFLRIAREKEEELNQEIQKLKNTKAILKQKREQLLFCETLKDQEIRMESCKAERILMLPYDFAENDVSLIFPLLKETWGIDQIRMGIGSMISLERVYAQDFTKYEGLFTIALRSSVSAKAQIKPAGNYLCGYQKDTWDKLPDTYQHLLDYAKEHKLSLTGYAYEVGLNDFAISDSEDYITKIMIQIQE